MSKNIVTYQQELEIKRSYWQKVITKWDKSGQKPGEYCRASGVNLDQFYYWRKKCSSTAPVTSNDNFIKLQVNDSDTNDSPNMHLTSKQRVNNNLQVDITLPNSVRFQLSTCISSLQELVTCFGGI